MRLPPTPTRRATRALAPLAGALALSLASAADAPGARTYAAAGVRALVVETSGGPIALTASEDKAVSVEVAPGAGDGCVVAQDLRGGTLTLTARASSRGFFGAARPCSAGFAVSAPARVDVVARSGSGKVDLGAFAGKSDVRTGSGAIEVHGATGELALRSGGGTVSGDAGGQRRIDVETGSGGVDLRELTGAVSARSGGGFVSLLWAAAPPSGDVDVRTGSGDFTAILPASARLLISFKSGSGKLSSDFVSDARAPLRLTFRSGSGSAEIKKEL